MPEPLYECRPAAKAMPERCQVSEYEAEAYADLVGLQFGIDHRVIHSERIELILQSDVQREVLAHGRAYSE